MDLTGELEHQSQLPFTAWEIWDSFFFFFLKNFFGLLLGLHCCARPFSSCGEWGLLFVAVHGLLVAVASLVAEHGL